MNFDLSLAAQRGWKIFPLVHSSRFAVSQPLLHDATSDEAQIEQSEDTTSVGRKCFRPNKDLPEPEGPTRRISDSSGMLIFMDRFAFYGVLAGCPKFRHPSQGYAATRYIAMPPGLKASSAPKACSLNRSFSKPRFRGTSFLEPIRDRRQ